MSSKRLAGLAALAALSGCSLLYDPASYRRDGGGPSSDALGIDAFEPPGVDAFVPPGVDADLDARVAPDAFEAAPDVFAPPELDASLDAPTSPDAGTTDPIWCPEDTSLALPTCDAATTTRLRYCDPERPAEVLGFPSESASALLGTMRSGGYRFGFLGNAIDVTSSTTRGGIADQELSREGDQLLLTIARNDGEPRVTRRAWRVVAAGLEAGASETYEIASLSATQILDLSHATSTDMALVYLDGGGRAAAGRCGRDTTCVTAPFATTPVGATAWIAHSSRGPVAASPVPSTPRLEFELLGSPTDNGNLGYDATELRSIEGLRSTDLPLAYTVGPGPQRAIDVSAGALLFRIGEGMPRITTGDIATNALVGRVGVSSGATTIGTRVATCSPAPCDCADCGGASLEASVTTDLPVRDWNLHNLDAYYRVAVLLMGDPSGTRVVVATWDVRASPVVVPPVVIATGRLSPVRGVGRSIRSVATRASGSLEVFVSVAVELSDDTEHVFLSGMRLLNCGS